MLHQNTARGRHLGFYGEDQTKKLENEQLAISKHPSSAVSHPFCEGKFGFLKGKALFPAHVHIRETPSRRLCYGISGNYPGGEERVDGDGGEVLN